MGVKNTVYAKHQDSFDVELNLQRLTYDTVGKIASNQTEF